MRRPLRALLAAGALGIVASGPGRTAAETEIEAAGYGGTTVGGWACGPVGRANYAGGAVRARATQRPWKDESGAGVVAETTFAAEYESVQITDCEQACDERGGNVAPPDRVLTGAATRLGYRWRYFGIDAGALVFQSWQDNTDPGPSLGGIPTLEVLAGRYDRFQIVAGLGAPTLTTTRRPGLYAGGDFPVGDGYRLRLRAGGMRQGPALGKIGFRTDGVFYMPVDDTLDLRFSASTGINTEDSLDGEASLGVLLRL